MLPWPPEILVERSGLTGEGGLMLFHSHYLLALFPPSPLPIWLLVCSPLPSLSLFVAGWWCLTMNELLHMRRFSKLLGIAVFPCPVGQFLGFGRVQGVMSKGPDFWCLATVYLRSWPPLLADSWSWGATG